MSKSIQLLQLIRELESEGINIQHALKVYKFCKRNIMSKNAASKLDSRDYFLVCRNMSCNMCVMFAGRNKLSLCLFDMMDDRIRIYEVLNKIKIIMNMSENGH